MRNLPALQSPSDDFRLGVKVNLFNHNFETAITEKQTELGIPRHELASLMGIHLTTLYRFRSFKEYPKEETKLRIAIILEKPPDHLFPEHLDGFRLKHQPDAIALTADEWVEMTGTEASPEQLMQGDDLKRVIAKVLETLTAREAQILRLRYGLSNEDGAKTLDEVAGVAGLSRERIRQIEAKALKKLRHITRAAELADFEGDDFGEEYGRRRKAYMRQFGS